MTDLDGRIVAALDAASPRLDGEAGDWQEVLRDAARRRSRGWARRAGLLAAAATAVLALLLAWPFGGAERGGVLDQALAAVGDGPVLHIVREGSWGGELVDLRTGERTRVPGITETWYDAERNFVRGVSRLGGVVQSDETFRARRGANELAALGVRYRAALEAGTARVFGEGTVEGEPVLWIVVRREDLPDVADRKNHAWTQQVAISKATYEPVATRETRDGVEGPGTRQLVRTLEYVSRDAADFGQVVDGARSARAMYFNPGFAGPALSLADAREVLGQAPVWAGRQLGELPLARIGKEQMGRYDPQTRTRDGIEGAVFVYGRLDVRQGDTQFDGPYVVVRQTTSSPLEYAAGNQFLPPPGKAFVGPNSALLRKEGLYVRVEASSAELALAAARALKPAGTN